MKKTLYLLMAAAMCTVLMACGSPEATEATTDEATETTTVSNTDSEFKIMSANPDNYTLAVTESNSDVTVDDSVELQTVYDISVTDSSANEVADASVTVGFPIPAEFLAEDGSCTTTFAFYFVAEDGSLNKLKTTTASNNICFKTSGNGTYAFCVVK